MTKMNRLLLLPILAITSCNFQDEPVFPHYPWEFAQPEEVGYDSEALFQIDRDIKSGNYGQLRSLLILKNDKQIFENYYAAKRSNEQEMSGSTVSVVSVLLGIAIEKNVIPSLDTPIKNLLPSYQMAFEDPLRSLITVENLISMKPGISWNELLRGTNDPANYVNQMARTSDWSNFALETSMEAFPGTRFSYNSGGLMILSEIFDEQTGMSLAEFGEENLFRKLDISATWISDPSGTTNAGWGLSLKPLDMAKIGYLCLNKGNWFGEQIVQREYAVTMGELESNYTFQWDYGLGWWRFSEDNTLINSIDENDVYFSWGLGGQFIFIIPHLDMMVALTADNFLNNEQLGMQLVMNRLIPALTKSAI